MQFATGRLEMIMSSQSEKTEIELCIWQLLLQLNLSNYIIFFVKEFSLNFWQPSRI